VYAFSWACRNVLLHRVTQTCRTSGFLEWIPGGRCLSLPMCLPQLTHTHTHTLTHSIPEGSVCHQACLQRSITSFHWDDNCDFLRIDLHHFTSVTLHMGVCTLWQESKQQCVCFMTLCVCGCVLVCVRLPFQLTLLFLAF